MEWIDVRAGEVRSHNAAQPGQLGEADVPLARRIVRVARL